MSSLGTIVPEGLYCYVLCYKASRHIMWFFTSTLIRYRAHTHTHTGFFMYVRFTRGVGMGGKVKTTPRLKFEPKKLEN